jgi:ATP-dependent helicase HrpA
MGAVHELEDLYRRTVDAWPKGRPVPPALGEVPWLLEELRVSHFAQGLGTRGPISAKRVRKVLEEAALAARA